MFIVAANTRQAIVGQKEWITTGSSGIQVQFLFSSDWDGLSKFAVFRNAEIEESAIPIALPASGLTELPAENCAAEYVDEKVYVGVYGTDGLGHIIIPTIWVSLGVLKEGAAYEGMDPPQPTPDMWAQIMAIAQNAGAENAAAAEQSAEEAEASKEAIQDMNVQAETLPDESPLTVTKEVDPETGAVTLIFGLTRGPKGNKGDDGYSPTIAITPIQGGHRFTVTDKEHPTGQSFDVMNGAPGAPGSPGAPGAPGDPGYSPEVTITTITGGHRVTITDEDHPTGQSFDVMDGQDGSGSVDDVQINGTSIVSSGVANIPLATASAPGVSYPYSNRGLSINADGQISVTRASDNSIKAGSAQYAPIVPSNQHGAAFYGLAKAAGDVTQAASDNPVGTYTDGAKAAIKDMIGATAGGIGFDDSETYPSGSLGAEVSDQKNAITQLDEVIFYKLSITDFEQGAYQPNSSIASTSDPVYDKRIGYATPIKYKAGSKVVYNVGNDYMIFARLYANPVGTNQTPLQDMGSSWVRFSGEWVLEHDGYITINIKYYNDAVIHPNDYSNEIIIKQSDVTGLIIKTTTALAEAQTAVNALQYTGIDAYLKSQFVTHMTHDGSGRYVPMNVRNAIISPLHYDFPVNISVQSGYRFAVQYYDGYEIGPNHLINGGPWTTSTLTINAGDYWCIIVAATNDAVTDDTTQDNLTFEATANFNDVYDKLMPLIKDSEAFATNSYVIGDNSVKTPIRVKSLGALTYAQSFCMYNGKYYSTDGDNIGIQNASFSAVSTKALSVGHGNAFQLGHNGKAYISDWSNPTIYVVDMESLTIDSTIALPTTGYTTAVVDDLNGIVYIFQRNSYPDTVVNYNFIVYDYQNQQTKSTRIINAFSAMQAADFYNGRIAVLWGLGTASNPSGMAIYNTSGDILAEFTLDIFKTAEPEGVFFDRETGEILVSTISKAVFKIE